MLFFSILIRIIIIIYNTKLTVITGSRNNKTWPRNWIEKLRNVWCLLYNKSQICFLFQMLLWINMCVCPYILWTCCMHQLVSPVNFPLARTCIVSSKSLVHVNGIQIQDQNSFCRINRSHGYDTKIRFDMITVGIELRRLEVGTRAFVYAVCISPHVCETLLQTETCRLG